MKLFIAVLGIEVSCALTCGCSNHSTEIDECIKTAISTEKFWESPFRRWGGTNVFYKSVFVERRLEDVVKLFLTNATFHGKGSVPLFVKFERISKPQVAQNDGRLVDLRGNNECKYRIDVVTFGHRSQLLANRFYFLCPQGKQSALWPRRFDNIFAGMGCKTYPRCLRQYDENVGTYNVRWTDIAPIFFGEEGWTLENFLKAAMSGGGFLLWGCGEYGLYEGKHIYATDKIIDWLGNWDFIIPLEVIFAARDTCVFSVGDWNTVHSLTKKWLDTGTDCSSEVTK